MRFNWIIFLGISALMAGCTHTVSAPSNNDESSPESSSAKKASSSSKKATSSSSKSDNITSSEAGELDEDCAGEPGNAWDGTTAKIFACGAGTKLSPYIILTAEQLAKLSFIVGANETEYQGKYYKLGADIILNEGKIIDDKGALVADSTKLHKWTPIGNSSVAFTGNFDGDGHTVSGMFINTTSTHNGLFGNSSGTVQNLTVENSWVQGGNATAGIIGNLVANGSIKNATNKASVIGEGNVAGGVVGIYDNGCCKNEGSIENAENYGILIGSKTVGGILGSGNTIKIIDTRNFAEITGKSATGGIVGSLGTNSTLERAKNTGKIIGKEMTAGIAGYLGYPYSCSKKSTTLKNAENTGSIEGEKFTAGVVGKNECSLNTIIVNKANIIGADYTSGILGYVNNSSTESAYNVGDVFGTRYVGGIAGYNEVGVSQSIYSTGKVDGDSLVGLMIGYNYNTTMADYYYLEQGEQEPFGLNNGGGVATPKTSDEMKSEDFAKLLGDEFVYDSELNDGYPILKWEEE